jgi:hypothetical protein
MMNAARLSATVRDCEVECFVVVLGGAGKGEVRSGGSSIRQGRSGACRNAAGVDDRTEILRLSFNRPSSLLSTDLTPSNSPTFVLLPIGHFFPNLFPSSEGAGPRRRHARGRPRPVRRDRRTRLRQGVGRSQQGPGGHPAGRGIRRRKARRRDQSCWDADSAGVARVGHLQGRRQFRRVERRADAVRSRGVVRGQRRAGRGPERSGAGQGASVCQCVWD